MSLPLFADWVIPTLNDISAFLTENGMHEAAHAVDDATSVVRGNGKVLFSDEEKVSSTSAICDGKVTRFCVYSRSQR